MVVHDLRCSACGALAATVPVELDAIPPCSVCGGAQAITWEGGRSPSLGGLYGNAQFNRGLGCEVSSTTEAEKIAKARGYEPCGDNHHGGPPEPSCPAPPQLVAKHERSAPTTRSGRVEWHGTAD